MASDSAWSEGWAQGREASQHRRDRKEMLSDEDRQIKATDLINTRNSILTKLPTLLGPNGEKTPEYDQAYQSLTQAQEGLGQLYHPDKAPGALQQDWHWLLGKMHGITAPKDKTPPVPPQPSSAPASTPAAPAVYQKTMGAGPSTPAALPPVTPENGGMQIPNTPGFGPTTAPPSSGATAAPLLITQSFADKPVPGMVTKGNIDLSKRPNIDNGDGTHSSTFSMSFGTDKGEVLVPGVGDGKTYPERQLRVLYTLPDGSQKWAVPGNQPHNWTAPERPTPQNNEALNQYQKTGKFFGIFKEKDDDKEGTKAAKLADAYGKTLHEDQEKYGKNGVTAHPVSPSGNINLPTPSPQTAAKPPQPTWGQAQVLKHKAAAMQKAQQEAGLLASGAPLSPQQQAMSQFRTEELVHQAQIDSTLKLAEKLGLSENAMDELKQQLVGLKNVTPKPLTGAAGQPYLGPDGLYRQAVTNPDGTVGFRQMPPDWKPNIKSVPGTVINTKEHGWIKTWVDPYTQKVTGWQPFTPGRTLTGTTSTSSSTDPFGLKTTSSRSTMPTNAAPKDFDFSGIQKLPDSFNGEDIPAASAQAPAAAPPPSGSPSKSSTSTSAPPKSVAKPTTGTPTPKAGPTPAQLRSQIPSPPQATGNFTLDATGHIPLNSGANPQLVGAANQLIDGMDIAKLTIPMKAKEAASNLARQYGWGGQGMFTPREALQLKEGATFLNMMANSPALKVLDNGFFANIAMTGASPDPLKEGFFGRLLGNAAARGQTPDQQKFMDLYRQLDAMAIGLRALVQTGRGTQKQTDLLISELPNPYNTPSSEDAKRRLGLVQKELNVAAKTGKLPEFEDMQKDFNSLKSPQGKQHKEGDWVMLHGHKVQIKKLYPDGTFDY